MNLLCVEIKKTRSLEKINRWKPKPIRAHSILCAQFPSSSSSLLQHSSVFSFVLLLACVHFVHFVHSLIAFCVGVFTFFVRVHSHIVVSCALTIASSTRQETVYSLYGILLHISVLFQLFSLVFTTSLRQMWKSLESKYGKSHQPKDSRSCVMCLTLVSAMPRDTFYIFWSMLSKCVEIAELCNGISCSRFNLKIAQPNS